MIEFGQYTYIGEAWVAVIKKIMQLGREVKEGSECYKELKGVIFCISCVENHENTDMILNKYGDSQIIQWMKDNFELVQSVKELHNANSYAARLYNYGGSKNQIQWIIDKINNKKNVRSATITTFEPLTDIGYIPCISLLDFDNNDDILDVYVYARALDFGEKAYANMLCIRDLLEKVASNTNCSMGNIHFICKSVHVYDYDYDKINRILEVN